MNWWMLPGLTDGQYYMLCVGVIAVAVTAVTACRRLCRRHRASLRHPANRAPYDWAADVRYRQAVTVHRKVS